jgi:hypothetical protein
VNAFRIEVHGRIAGLKPTKLRGMIEVDPAQQDFFRVVVEERQRLSTRTDLSVVEKDRLNKALKVLANAASYGIYAEMHRLESEQKVKTTCYGIDAEPFAPRVSAEGFYSDSWSMLGKKWKRHTHLTDARCGANGRVKPPQDGCGGALSDRSIS